MDAMTGQELWSFTETVNEYNAKDNRKEAG